MNRINIIIILSISMTFTFCSKEEDSKSNIAPMCDVGNYYPNSKGSFWTYVTRLDTGNTIDTLSSAGLEKYVIVSDTNIGGILYNKRLIYLYFIETYPNTPLSGPNQYESSLFRILSNEVHYLKYDYISSFGGITELLYYSPCSLLGDSIETVQEISDGLYLNGTYLIVTQVDEEYNLYELGSKTFSDVKKCSVKFYKLYKDGQGNEIKEYYFTEWTWLAKDIGPIRIENSMLKGWHKSIFDYKIN